MNDRDLKRVGKAERALINKMASKTRKTRADQLRAMTDEELAEYLCNTISSVECNSSCPAWDYCRTGHNGMLDFLKHEAICESV